MALVSFPTSKDVYIEVDGKRLAAAQSYKAKTSRESRFVEAFGSDEPVGTVGGRVKYLIELSRVVICGGSAAEVRFHNLSNVNIVVVRPDRKIIYSGCEWSGVDEAIGLNDLVYETVTAVASSRMEVAL